MPVEVRVQELTKRYGDTVAVAGVSLEIERGEIFGILGPNGAGKTTMVECILGLRKSDGGTIQVSGIDAMASPNRLKAVIGAQLQATALQDKITPREAIRLFGSFYDSAISAERLLERFALSEKADASFDSLSGGQQQRLALALAFVNDPRVMFLDEPSAGLDPQSRRGLHEHILQLRGEGRTIVLTTHYMEEAQRLCDRIAIIKGGRIVAMDTPGALVARGKVVDRVVAATAPDLSPERVAELGGSSVNGSCAFSTEDVGALIVRLVKVIEAEGVRLVDLRIERGTLEGAYLNLIGEEI